MKHAIVLVVLAATSWSSYSQAYEWKLKKEIDGIQVFFRKSPDSKINELRIETTVEASLSAIVTLMRDVPSFTNWIFKCVASERLYTPSDQESIYYGEMDFPWPMSNRDFIAHSRVSQDENTKTVVILSEGLPGYIPEKKGLIRMPLLKVKWEITPIQDGKVRIAYNLQSDPGGSIPPWLINMAIDQGPTNSIKRLQNMLYKEKYKNAQLSFIQEVGE